MSEGRDFTRRELFRLVDPRHTLARSGRLELDRAKCSACGLCTRECSSAALSMIGKEGVSLVFKKELCDACGRCVEICPEQCLTLVRVLPSLSTDTDEAASGPVVLFEDGVATCPTCGAAIGSKAMIERVRAKLQVTDPVLAARLQLCPVCKGRGSSREHTDSAISLKASGQASGVKENISVPSPDTGEGRGEGK